MKLEWAWLDYPKYWNAAEGWATVDAAQRDYDVWVPDPSSLLPMPRD